MRDLKCAGCGSIFDLMSADWCWVKTGGQVRSVKLDGQKMYLCDGCGCTKEPVEVEPEKQDRPA